MTVERWELLPSSHPDRYILKIRGERQDVEKVAQTFARVCQETLEIHDPVYQWGIYVVGATLNERLAIQDQLREMVKRPSPREMLSAGPMLPDLAGVLSELSQVLDGFTNLSDEERAHVEKKVEQMQQTTTALPAGPLAASPPAASPSRSPEAARSAEPTAEREAPGFEVVHDVASPPGVKTPPQLSAEEAKAPEPPAQDKSKAQEGVPPGRPALSQAQLRELLWPKGDSKPPGGASAAPPAPVVSVPAIPEGVNTDQVIRAVGFFADGHQDVYQNFVRQLTEVAQKKAKRPLFVQFLVSQASPLSPQHMSSWVKTAVSVSAECLFALLTRDQLPDFFESALLEARGASLSCFLVPEGDLESRVLYVDLMVELMLIKRKK